MQGKNDTWVELSGAWTGQPGRLNDDIECYPVQPLKVLALQDDQRLDTAPRMFAYLTTEETEHPPLFDGHWRVTRSNAVYYYTSREESFWSFRLVERTVIGTDTHAIIIRRSRKGHFGALNGRGTAPRASGSVGASMSYIPTSMTTSGPTDSAVLGLDSAATLFVDARHGAEVSTLVERLAQLGVTSVREFATLLQQRPLLWRSVLALLPEPADADPRIAHSSGNPETKRERPEGMPEMLDLVGMSAPSSYSFAERYCS